MHDYCHVFLFRFISENTHTECLQCNWKKTQAELNCHYKFILAKDIIFVSSDDIHA